MKYLKLHPINENLNWLLSKKDDIIECSYELIDLPYDFHYCGREGEGGNSYLNYVRGKYTISYSGRMVVDDGTEDIWSFGGFVTGEYDEEGFNFNIYGEEGGMSISRSTDYLIGKRKGNFKKLVDSLLPAVEDVIIKLRGNVFNEGEWTTSIYIETRVSNRFVHGEDVWRLPSLDSVEININIMFQKK